MKGYFKVFCILFIIWVRVDSNEILRVRPGLIFELQNEKVIFIKNINSQLVIDYTPILNREKILYSALDVAQYDLDMTVTDKQIYSNQLTNLNFNLHNARLKLSYFLNATIEATAMARPINNQTTILTYPFFSDVYSFQDFTSMLEAYYNATKFYLRKQGIWPFQVMARVQDFILLYENIVLELISQFQKLQRELSWLLSSQSLSRSFVTTPHFIKFLQRELSEHDSKYKIPLNDLEYYYRLCKVTRIQRYDSLIYLDISIPLKINQNSFTVYESIPVATSLSIFTNMSPFAESSTLTTNSSSVIDTSIENYSIIIKPQTKFLAVSSQDEWFMELEDINDKQKCVKIALYGPIFCRVKLAFMSYETSDSNCLISSYLNEPRVFDVCAKYLTIEITTNPHFIYLSRGRWFYTLTESNFEIEQICRTIHYSKIHLQIIDKKITLPKGIGIFQVERNCFAQSTDERYKYKSWTEDDYANNNNNKPESFKAISYNAMLQNVSYITNPKLDTFSFNKNFQVFQLHSKNNLVSTNVKFYFFIGINCIIIFLMGLCILFIYIKMKRLNTKINKHLKTDAKNTSNKSLNNSNFNTTNCGSITIPNLNTLKKNQILLQPPFLPPPPPPPTLPLPPIPPIEEEDEDSYVKMDFINNNNNNNNAGSFIHNVSHTVDYSSPSLPLSIHYSSPLPLSLARTVSVTTPLPSSLPPPLSETNSSIVNNC